VLKSRWGRRAWAGDSDLLEKGAGQEVQSMASMGGMSKSKNEYDPGKKQGQENKKTNATIKKCKERTRKGVVLYIGDWQ